MLLTDIASSFTKIAITSLLLTVFQPVYASQQDDDVFDCSAATSASAQKKQQTAAELLNHTYDTSRLACGAQLMIGFADEKTGDYDAQLLALRSNALNIYYLDRVVLYELGYLISWYVTEVPEETKLNGPMIALIAAQKEQMRILQQARAAKSDSAELDYYEALSLGPVAKALPLLKGVVDEEPQSLHGAAHALLGETYYALPDIFGGDLDLAVAMLRTAMERAPDNPRYARLLAGYLLDVDLPDEASSTLRQLLSMHPSMAGWQLLADQLRVAADMAERIGDNALAEQLSQRRNDMLEKHPFLQTRTVVSAMGHFGDKDPMSDPDKSGKDEP